MKIAYYRNKNSEIRKIDADDPRCNKHSEYTCPCCGERVTWNRCKVYPNYFSHWHGSKATECNFYCTSITGTSLLYAYPYKAEGTSLYLYFELSQYYLALGMSGLEEETINEAVKMGTNLIINRGKKDEKIRINQQNFEPKKIEFIKLLEIKEKYDFRIEPSNMPEEITEKWWKKEKQISGVANNTAIFEFGDYAGRKVSCDNGIRMGKMYVLLTTENILNHPISNNINFEKLKDLSITSKKSYYLYKFSVEEKTEAVAAFFRSFDMEVKNTEPQIIPIWPPCVNRDQEIIYNQESKKYFVLKNDISQGENLHSHKSHKKAICERINYSNRCIIVNELFDDDTLVVKNEHDFVFVNMIVDKLEKQHNNLPIEVLNDNGINNKSVITNLTKIHINRLNGAFLLESKFYKEQENIEFKLHRNEKIELLHGLDVVWSMTYQKIEKNVSNNIKDKKLLDKINHYKGQTIPIPNGFKWIIYKHKKKHPQSYLELLKLIQTKRISIELFNILIMEV